MLKRLKRIGDLPYAVLAAATVSVTATEANAQQTAGDVAQNLIDQAGAVGKLVVAGTFIGGLVMLGTGLMKLKAAAENPNQTKYSEGLWRCGVGAAMVAIPAFSGTLSATLGFGDSPDITAGGGAQF